MQIVKQYQLDPLHRKDYHCLYRADCRKNGMTKHGLKVDICPDEYTTEAMVTRVNTLYLKKK